MTFTVPEFTPRRRVLALVGLGVAVGAAVLVAASVPRHFDGRVTAVGEEIKAVVIADFQPTIGETWVTEDGLEMELLSAHRQEDTSIAVSLRLDGDAPDFEQDNTLVGTAGSSSLFAAVVKGVVRG